MKRMEQSIIFLKKCQGREIFPQCISTSLSVPTDIKQSAACENLLRSTSLRILKLLIQSQYSKIAQIKSSCQEVSSRLPAIIKTTLQPIVSEAASDAKMKAKSNCRKKFAWLSQREPKPNQTTRNVVPLNHHASIPLTHTTSDRYTIMDELHVSEITASALARGPNFAITPRMTTESLHKKMQIEVVALAYGARWKRALTTSSDMDSTTTTATATSPTCSNEKKPTKPMLNTEASYSTQPPLSGTMPVIPFEGKRKAPPKLDIDLEKRIKTLQVDIEQLVQRATLPKQNIPKEEYQSLVSLRNNPVITAIRSDKGGEMVLMKTTTLDKLTMDHLNDTSTYEKMKTDPTENLRKTVNSTLKEILTNRGYPLSFTNRLMTSSAKTQRFYSLPKTHKPTLKIRPIFSGKAAYMIDWVGYYRAYSSHS